METPTTKLVSIPTSSSSLQVVSPCAACKILRRRCVIDQCILAPYFPPTETKNFIITHRVFGASNIIKFLQELPEWQRSDAVSSLVYEAFARVRDPVYGCAGTISHLQKQVRELEAELVKTQADLIHIQSNQAKLDALICNNKSYYSQHQHLNTYLQHKQSLIDTSCSSFMDDEFPQINYTNWESNLGESTTCWNTIHTMLN